MADVQPVVSTESGSDVSNGARETDPIAMDEETGDKQGLKRPADQQLGPDDIAEDEKSEEPGDFPKASDDVMAQRTLLTPAASMDQDEDVQGARMNTKPTSGFKLNPPTLIHGQAKSAPKSEGDEKENEQIKPLLRPSFLNHHLKGDEEPDEAECKPVPEPPAKPEVSETTALTENNSDAESDAMKRTNYFLRLTTDINERDVGFGVFGKFRDHSGYRIGFEGSNDSGAASGNSSQDNRGGPGLDNHDGATHENYFMQFTSRERTNDQTSMNPLARANNTIFRNSNSSAAGNALDLNSSGDSPTSLSSSSGSSFLFGQNMNERVTSPNRQEGELQSAGELVFGQNLSSRIKADGFSETSPEKTKEQTLAENASALEEARQRMRRKFEDVESVTGEEDEENVVQSHCKLFLFDQTKRSWLEKGRGQIRLNDSRQTSADSSFQSRLVMRTQGSLRVILNTKLWSGMTIEKANIRSLRISAMDAESETVKVFLITGAHKDIEQLFCAIEYRVQALKHVEEERLRQEAEGTDGQARAADSRDGAGGDGDGEDDEDDGEDDEDDDDDEDSEVAKICSRDRSKPTSPKSIDGNSASASPSLHQEDS